MTKPTLQAIDQVNVGNVEASDDPFNLDNLRLSQFLRGNCRR